MKVTYYGHACFAVEIRNSRLLFDPFVSGNELARGRCRVNDLEADYVLLSHGHIDHVGDAEAVCKRTGATLIAAYEVAKWFEDRGVKQTHAMNHGGGFNFPFGRVKFVAAIHSSVLPDGTYGGNPGGFVIESEEGNFYYSGDTALTSDMKLIGESVALDWAALCIGDNFTMGARDAAVAAQFVRVKTVLGVHYDTFPEIKIDHAHAREIFAADRMSLVLAKIGETIDLPGR